MRNIGNLDDFCSAHFKRKVTIHKPKFNQATKQKKNTTIKVQAKEIDEDDDGKEEKNRKTSKKRSREKFKHL